MLRLSHPFHDHLLTLTGRLIRFEEDPRLLGASIAGHALRSDYAFWLYHRVAQSFRGMALIILDNFASAHPEETSLPYGILRHLLENYADLYNAYTTGGKSYWYWRYMGSLRRKDRGEADFQKLALLLPDWAEHGGPGGQRRRANRLTRYVMMAPLPPLLSGTLPGLTAFHERLRRLDSRASSAFHSNSPAFLMDTAACNEELLLSMHLALSSALALIAAIYQRPWDYDLESLIWPPLLTNLRLLQEGRALLQ